MIASFWLGSVVCLSLSSAAVSLFMPLLVLQWECSNDRLWKALTFLFQFVNLAELFSKYSVCRIWKIASECLIARSHLKIDIPIGLCFTYLVVRGCPRTLKRIRTCNSLLHSGEICNLIAKTSFTSWIECAWQHWYIGCTCDGIWLLYSSSGVD